MSAGTFLGEVGFTAHVLPARVCYLIAARSKAGMLRAVQEACTRWAGGTEPIVAVSSTGRVQPWDRQLVELLKVDAAVIIDAPATGAAKFADSLGLPVVDIAHIDYGGSSGSSTFPPLVNNQDQLFSSLPLPSTDELWEHVAIGSLSPEAAVAMDETRTATWRPPGQDRAGVSQLSNATLVDFTLSQFGETWMRNGPRVAPAVLWVARPDDVDDCRGFWNMRALRSIRFAPHPMVLIPDVGYTHWVDFPRLFRNVLARRADLAPDVVIASNHVPHERLDDIAADLGLELHDGEMYTRHRFPAPPRRTEPFTYRTDVDCRQWFAFERTYGEQATFRARLFREDTTIDFESPVRFTGSGRTMLRVSSSAFNSYPRQAAIAEAVLPNATWRGDDLEIHTSAAARYTFQLRLPDLASCLTNVLARHGITHSVSDKGALAMSLADRFELDALTDPDLYRIVLHLTTPRSPQLVRAVEGAKRQGMDLDQLHALTSSLGGQGSRRYQSAAELTSRGVKATPEQLETLTRLGICERGLVVKRCPDCGLSTFVMLTEATPDGRCPACHQRAGYLTSRDGPTIAYRLNAIVDRACDQGVVLQALAANGLGGRSGETYLLPGADLCFPSGEKGEADLLGIAHRRLTVGEVKTFASQFTRPELEKDVARAHDAGADLLVLACPEPLSDSTLRYAERLARRARVELQVVDPLAPRSPPQ